MVMVATFLKHGSNVAIVAMSLLLAAAMGLHAVAFVPVAILIGALLFFLTEYSTHRFLLHAPPLKNPFVLRMQHRLHYDHHVEPERLDLLFLPPWFLFPALAIFVAAYFAIARNVAVVAALVLGNLLGLLYYEWVHYVAHIPYRPRTPVGRWMKKYHLWHHFKNEHLWFGVTNPSMDFVWRTYVRVDEADRSGSTRILFR
jgi:4-hydroxysphinganine ceramide fatty acyl 2-hydroxylase